MGYVIALTLLGGVTQEQLDEWHAANPGWYTTCQAGAPVHDPATIHPRPSPRGAAQGRWTALGVWEQNEQEAYTQAYTVKVCRGASCRLERRTRTAWRPVRRQYRVDLSRSYGGAIR